MPDISCCTGKDCPVKDDCYRYRAERNKYRQSMFFIPPYNYQKGRCDYFWPLEEAHGKLRSVEDE